jgi:cyclopropane fatty-acyl-phospholipid synthase-like methyltransferase
MGRIATSELAALAHIEHSDEVLDARSGVGGTARYLADQFGAGGVLIAKPPRVYTHDCAKAGTHAASARNRCTGIL